MDQVIIVYSPHAKKNYEFHLSLDEIKEGLRHDVTVYDVICATGLFSDYPELKEGIENQVGIWGKALSLDSFVQAGDRVEIYRPLQIDPKDARRLRYKEQGPIHSRHRPGYKGP